MIPGCAPTAPQPRRAPLRLQQALGLCLCLLGLLPLWACDPFHTNLDASDLEYRQAASLTPLPAAVPETLRVATWNIKFGGGRIDFFWDCYGDRVLMDASEVDAHLQALADAIGTLDPDVILLQEIDLNSRRTAFIDQVQWLLDHTALNHGVYASGWRADFIPSDGIGAMDSGNAILSRYPLEDAERIALELRTDQSRTERYFYLRRNLLTARVAVKGRAPIAVANVHTAAYSQDGTKKKHIDAFHAKLSDWADADVPFFAGGDLNTLPPDSEKQHAFPDSICEDEAFKGDDYREETRWLEPLYRDFSSAVDLDDYADDNTRHFTHTVDSQGFWTRKLDYLFTNQRWQAGQTITHQQADSGGIASMPLSDHAPVSAVLELSR